MAAKAKRAKVKAKADPLRDKAADYFAARSHDAWRRTLLKTNPEQKGKPRMRMRGGVMVDVNQPWSKLHAKAKTDNKQAAYDAYDAVRRFPNDREAAAAYVHERWIKRNKGDPSQPKELFKSYRQLSEVEKDKDRAHVDAMKKALAAVTKRKETPLKTRVATYTTVRIDARAWRRLETAARALSRTLGRPVSAAALLHAGVDAMTAVSKGLAAEARSKA